MLVLMLSLSAFVALPATAYADVPLTETTWSEKGMTYIKTDWELVDYAEVWGAIYKGDGTGIVIDNVVNGTGTGFIDGFYNDLTTYSGPPPIPFQFDCGGLEPDTRYTMFMYSLNGDGYGFTTFPFETLDIPIIPEPVLTVEDDFPAFGSTYVESYWLVDDENYYPVVYVALYEGPDESLTAAEVVAANGAIDDYSGDVIDWGFLWYGYQYYNLAPATEYTLYAVALNDIGYSNVVASTFTTLGNKPPSTDDICAIYVDGGANDIGFKSIEQAMRALQLGTGDFIYLLDDIVTTEGLGAWTNATIDTRDHDLEVDILEVDGGSLYIFSSLGGEWDMTVNNENMGVFSGGYLEIEASSITANNIYVVNESGLYFTADSLFMSYMNINESEARIDVDEIIASANGEVFDVNNNSQLIINGNITANGENSIAIYADSSASVTANGNIKADYGVIAEDSSTEVVVTGNINAAYNGIEAYSSAFVTVNGSIVAGSNGVYADDAETVVVVNGNIQADGYGVVAVGLADVTVRGDIEAQIGVRGGFLEGAGASITVVGNILAQDYGAIATLASVISVTGDITVLSNNADESAGIIIIQGSDVTVVGNIKAVIGIVAGDLEYEGGTAFITGNIIADAIGILAQNSSVINVIGNITATDPEEGIGVAARYGVEVTVDGIITARYYIGFDDGEGYYDYRAIGSNDPTSLKAGYRQYKDSLEDTSYVWVRTPPTTVIPPTTTPATGDSLALGMLYMFLMSALGAYGFLTRRRVLEA